MSIVVGGIYAHPTILGRQLFRVLAVTDTNVVLRPVTGRRRFLIEDTVNHFLSGCYTLIHPVTEPDDLLAVAEAVGVVAPAENADQPVPHRVTGEQPAIEFTAGPVGPGALWADAHLARVFFGGETA